MRSDPRKTELGRSCKLDTVTVEQIAFPDLGPTFLELDMWFTDKEGARRTHFVLGEFDLTRIPVLAEEDANRGWMSSMGFGNHPFYETRAEHSANRTMYSTYYAFLTDGDDVWLNGHSVGIDGPLLHFSDAGRRMLHVWLLSFERHALVGHYVIDLG